MVQPLERAVTPSAGHPDPDVVLSKPPSHASTNLCAFCSGIAARIRVESVRSFLRNRCTLSAECADAQAYDFTTLDDPSAPVGNYPNGGTAANGISGNTVVGDFYTGKSYYGNHGFIETNGDFTTTLDYSSMGTPARFTSALGISGNTVVGLYIDGDTPIPGDQANSSHGYMYNISTGVYSPINVTGSTLTYTYGIAGNAVVGLYEDSNGNNGYHGYILINGTLTTLDDPNAGTGANQGTRAQGIYEDAFGGYTVVGSYVDAKNVTHGFQVPVTGTGTTGDFETIDDPLNTGYSILTGVYGSTDVGTYSDASGTHGFTDTGGVFATIDDPNTAGDSSINGIYNGTLVGTFVDSSSNQHGFIATTPEPGPLALLTGLGITGVSLLIRRRLRRN